MEFTASTPAELHRVAHLWNPANVRVRAAANVLVRCATRDDINHLKITLKSSSRACARCEQDCKNLSGFI